MLVNETSMAARDTKEGGYEKNIFFTYMLSCLRRTIYRTMTSRWHGTHCFRRYGRELVSKPAILAEEKLAGATVERLLYTLLSTRQLKVVTMSGRSARERQ